MSAVVNTRYSGVDSDVGERAEIGPADVEVFNTLYIFIYIIQVYIVHYTKYFTVSFR